MHRCEDLILNLLNSFYFRSRTVTPVPKSANGCSWRGSNFFLIIRDYPPFPVRDFLRHGSALTFPMRLPAALWSNWMLRLISVTSASPFTVHLPQEASRQNKKAPVPRLSGVHQYLWGDTERRFRNSCSQHLWAWERVVSHPYLQSIAEQYDCRDFHSCDHMRFISPLSSVTPSPRAETRSKHPPRLPCPSRQCFCYCCTAWPLPWASTNCASPWWARMRARFGSSTPASRNPRPWKTTCELRSILPESPVGTPRKGFALWWVHIRSSFAYIKYKHECWHERQVCCRNFNVKSNFQSIWKYRKQYVWH